VASSGWKCPGAIRGGATAHERVEQVYASIKRNLGTALSTEDSALNMIEVKAAARAIALMDRAIDRRLANGDARTMSAVMVARWEAILGINPPSSQSLWDQRRVLAARLTEQYSNSGGAIARIATEAFDPWTIHVHYTTTAGAVVYWPGDGSSTTDLFWYSTLAHFAVEYVRPASASQTDVDQRKASCFEALDGYVADWVTWDFSETPAYGATALLNGFYLDRPNLDAAVLTAS